MDQKNNSLIVPIAIVLAGTLVGAGIFFSGKKNTNTGTYTKPATTESVVISVDPITADDHILGNPNAPIAMIEFSDTECPFCKQFHQTMNKIMTSQGKDGKVAWVYRHFPIATLHPKAAKESEASECVAELGGNDKFWQYMNKIYETTPSNNGLDATQLPKIAGEIGIDKTKFNTCLSSGKYASKIDGQIAEAQKAGARGTPTTIIVLKNKASVGVQSFISDSITKLGIPSDILKISDDKTKIFVGGALPYDFMNQLVSVLTI